jgi:selenocysteine-specific elongation factor
VAELVGAGALVELGGGIVVAAERYRSLAGAVRQALEARAASHPLEPVVPAAALLPEASREALAARLERDGIAVRDGSGLRAPGAVAGSSAVAEAADALVAALGQTPFAPPRLDDALAGLALTPAEARALVGVLEREGRIVRVGDGLAVTREAYDAAVAHVREGCAAGGSYTLAELRDATGTSRRWAQALLERMDADGITRRVGDARVLRRSRT